MEKYKNIFEKYSYKLWKHLNKQYGENIVPDFIQSVLNFITALSNELNQLKAQNTSSSLRRLSVINYNSSKVPLNILFLCPDKDVFCLENLFRLMEQSEEFNPIVGVFPYEHFSPSIKFNMSKYENVIRYLEQKQMKFVPLYDFEEKEYLSLKNVSISPERIRNNPNELEALHQAGVRVFSPGWNSIKDLKEAEKLGVDVATTDLPMCNGAKGAFTKLRYHLLSHLLLGKKAKKYKEKYKKMQCISTKEE